MTDITSRDHPWALLRGDAGEAGGARDEGRAAPGPASPLAALQALQAWMDAQGLGAGPLTDAICLTGGTQNILVRFSRAGRTYVLRRPPPHPRDNSNETMRREARMLAALAGTDVPHPALIACGDETVIGAAFYLMEPIDGFSPGAGLPAYHAGSAPARHRMGLAMVEAAAKLGALDYRALGLEGFGRVDNYLERQVARWRAQLESYVQHSDWPGASSIPHVDAVARWIERHRPSRFEPGIIHGDYHAGNVMFEHHSAELAAIVDWELTTVGDPLLDVGWLLAFWPDDGKPDEIAELTTPWDGVPTTRELLDHYSTRTRRDMSAIQWYGVLACYKLGILLEGTHARACAGKAPEETGERFHRLTVGLFERAARRMR